MVSKFLKVAFCVFILVAVLLSSVFIAFAVDAKPTIKLYLGEYEIQNADGKNYIKVPVYISDNTAELFTINYRVISQDKLTPVSFEDGDFCLKNSAGTLVIVKLNSTYTINPDTITKCGNTGVQILQDSSNGTRGISTKSGLIGTVWFEVPDTSAKYEFSIENLGFSNVYTDSSGKKQIGVYTVTIPSEDKFTSTQQTPPDVSISNPSIDKNKDTESQTQNTQSENTSGNPQGGIDNTGKKPQNNKVTPQNNKATPRNIIEYSKYGFALLGALAVTAVIIITVIFFKKKSKGTD